MKNKIAFMSTSNKVSKEIEKYLDKSSEFIVVDVNLSNSLEKARSLVEDGIKVIIAKTAIKLKIEKNIPIPIVAMENTLSDYIELLDSIDTNKKITFIDFIEPPQSFKKLIKISNRNINFKFFSDEETCKQVINEAIKSKSDVIIGGILVKKYAKDKEVEVYDLPISEDTVSIYKEIGKQVLENISKKNIKDEVVKNIEVLIKNYLDNDNKMSNNILDKITMNDTEKDKIIKALKKNSFSIIKTAKDLEMSRTTLWRKLKKFNITII
ncbi:MULTISPECIES: PrpR N-terminal domain-containing protein [Fusobacterium]|uniref:PrpR N-terminal domain-containing protein n=1 Tax=Fusobacterium TaxID=848 RepID=UPI0025C3F3EE|nr:PrpR N-terminal domain-containing protein [Fusobacterium sp.]MCI7223864.1 PrpR N-terminal domain-containing protein [Fusobacterium sp.]MDD7410188.1 PrpR N-terminal domain-containing protein [Fusobacteriaceae bacterium]MDY5305767.1 PrpR N-terminal domain-containing protein [Fusobacterium gastrosuis]MDY5712572.1 PrpR N-terminal domain-containing protein [Fusobacterium gastrosuis]